MGGDLRAGAQRGERGPAESDVGALEHHDELLIAHLHGGQLERLRQPGLRAAPRLS